MWNVTCIYILPNILWILWILSDDVQPSKNKSKLCVCADTCGCVSAHLWASVWGKFSLRELTGQRPRWGRKAGVIAHPVTVDSVWAGGPTSSACLHPSELQSAQQSGTSTDVWEGCRVTNKQIHTVVDTHTHSEMEQQIPCVILHFLTIVYWLENLYNST